MKRSRVFLSGGVAMALLALLIVGCPNPMDTMGLYTAEKAGASPGETAFTAGDLVAGRSMKAGTVEVKNDAENLYVTYQLEDGWVMTGSHLAVALSLGDIPQTRTGNPIPGQFTWKMPHDSPETVFTYAIGLGELGYEAGDLLYLAAHAEVRLVDGTGATIREESAWAAGIQFPGKNWATYFTCQPVTAHSVFYDANSATGGSVPDDPAHYPPGQAVTVLGNPGDLVREGYDFAGWNAQADGTGSTYTAGQTFLMGSVDVTLYAMWEVATANIDGYWDATFFFGGGEMGPMPFLIRQSGTGLEAAFRGEGSLAGTIQESQFSLFGLVFDQPISMEGTASGGILTGTVSSGAMSGTFRMVPSTLPFGTLWVRTSAPGVPYFFSTENALAEKPVTMTYIRFRFSVDDHGIPVEIWCAVSELLGTHFEVTPEDPDNEPGLIGVTVWREGEHRATGGQFDLDFCDDSRVAGTFRLDFEDGTPSLEGQFDLPFGLLGSASLTGCASVVNFAEKTVSTYSSLSIWYWDIHLSFSAMINVNGELGNPEYLIPEAAHVDVMWSIDQVAQDWREANLPGALEFSQFSTAGATGGFRSGFTEGGDIECGFSVSF